MERAVKFAVVGGSALLLLGYLAKKNRCQTGRLLFLFALRRGSDCTCLCLELLAEDEKHDDSHVLLYYKYCPIADPDAECKRHEEVPQHSQKKIAGSCTDIQLLPTPHTADV